MVALAVYEGRAMISLDQARVSSLMKKFLGETRKRTFYFHTEKATVQEITQQLRLDYLDLRMPPLTIRNRLLAELTTPGGNGGRHFRYLLMFPGKHI